MWQLQNPGVSTISLASMVRSAGVSRSSSALPTSTMRCPSTTTEPSRMMRLSPSIVTMKRAPSSFSLPDSMAPPSPILVAVANMA